MGSIFYNKKEEFSLEVKDLPQITQSTESDHVVSSTSQKTRLISFKNIFEKISFSSLATKAKTIIGAINELKADLKNSEITVSRTSAAWLAQSYVSYNVCEYTIQSDGIYLAFATVIISETKADRAYYMALNQNSEGNGSRITMNANNAYNVIAPLSYVFTCKAGDRIYTSAQANYVAENYAGLATGYLKLIKLHS